jgi:superfamily I DNA/RNA helicase/mRNA-degrading endonuclease RelE of RelBE toxin-antitoxin system
MAGAIPATVAISADFLNAFSAVPKGKQAKVVDFVTKFMADPTRPGINYEPIKKARDPKLRSVRIDEAYRGIVLKPDAGNVFVLLYVDHHDKAYQWAENKVCGIHPEIGSIQVFDVVEKSAAKQHQEPYSGTLEKGLFDHLRDKDIRRLGVPDELLPLVRSFRDENDLDEASAQLPQEAYEALSYAASGYDLQEIMTAMERPVTTTPVDVDDYARALQNDDTKRRFVVVEGETELAEMLSAPLEKWRVFLHPVQRKLVERDWNGPVRVLGGAGTGKTVAAMHRAKWLAENRFTGPNDRILFTTFTRNLAEDIKQNLAKICSPEAMKRIEVVNLDRWVHGFLQQQGYQREIIYDSRIRELWDKALQHVPSELKLPESFYREEWDTVIQPQGVQSLEQYWTASRIGRGTKLNRMQRKLAWHVFEEYRLDLSRRRLAEVDDALRDAESILQANPRLVSYKAIIVDEAQDMGMSAFRLIRQITGAEDSKNNVFIVGDGHQRIYNRQVVLSRAGIKITGRSRKLRINYRTTEENRRWAVSILEGVSVDDLDGTIENQAGYKSLTHGIPPAIKAFPSFKEEVAFLAEHLSGLQQQGDLLKDTCLVARTKKLLDQYESALKDHGIHTYRIKRGEAENRGAEGVRVATMHRVKGLEFDRIIVAGVNEGVLPDQVVLEATSDPAVRKDTEFRERALLYVAATRAKKEVVVTSFGRPSELLRVVHS